MSTFSSLVPRELGYPKTLSIKNRFLKSISDRTNSLFFAVICSTKSITFTQYIWNLFPSWRNFRTATHARDIVCALLYCHFGILDGSIQDLGLSKNQVQAKPEQWLARLNLVHFLEAPFHLSLLLFISSGWTHHIFVLVACNISHHRKVYQQCPK